MNNLNPQFPVYIISKGRHESRVTSRFLESMGVPYFIIVEKQEYSDYAAVIDPAKILVLPERYQTEYDTCDDLGETKSKGPGPARNFAWDHALRNGHPWHWVMDDNIYGFYRLNRNVKVPVSNGKSFQCMEDFCLRYENVAMAGPNYFMFAPRRERLNPFTLNTRVYSCNLIRNDIPFRWRGRYNEDTDLSLRILKSGLCTVLFNALLQRKAITQTLPGGNTDEFYAVEGTDLKSQMIVDLHPDVARLTERYGRPHHFVDYRPFRANALKLKPAISIPESDNYGMALKLLPDKSWHRQVIPREETFKRGVA